MKNSMNEYIFWHNRFGHLKLSKLRQFHDVIIVPYAIQIKHVDAYICDACDVAKFNKYKNYEYHTNVKNLLKFVAVDTCDFLPKTFEGFRYFLQIIDHYIKRVSAISVKTRDGATISFDK